MDEAVDNLKGSIRTKYSYRDSSNFLDAVAQFRGLSLYIGLIDMTLDNEFLTKFGGIMLRILYKE